MVVEKGTYSLKTIIKEIQLPFIIRKPNFSSNFVCRVDCIDGNNVICTGFKDGIEYTARKYTYLLDAEVIFICGERRKPMLPEIRDFFSNASVMNSKYSKLITDERYNTAWIRTLVVNYLALIKRKIRRAFDNNDFDVDNIELFTSLFPAYANSNIDDADLSTISLLLADIFVISLTAEPNVELSLTASISSVLSVHRCQISFGDLSFAPEVQSFGEITAFGVFALINTFLDSNERNSLAFDLLNESSNRSHYYLENLLMKSLPATNNAQSVLQENEEKERTILSLYVHRRLTAYYIISSEGSNTFMRSMVEAALFLGDSNKYTLGGIAQAVQRYEPDSDSAQRLIEELFAIAVNRKYYNLIKWQNMESRGSFLKNAERFCRKIIYISENLITTSDEKTIHELTGKQELRAINCEQAKEMKERFGTNAIPFEKIYLQLYHVSDVVADVLYDDTLLGSNKKWFFTFEQDEDNIELELVEGFVFNKWDSVVLSDSPLARITLLTDCCDEVSIPDKVPDTELHGDGIEVIVDEQNEEFNEEVAQEFYATLERIERAPEPCRTVLFTPNFLKSLQNLEGDVAGKVDLIKKKFAFLPDSELKSYLASQNSKHLRGRRAGDIPFYKFRLSRSARLFFCYGSDLKICGEEYPKGTIVLSEVVTDHDKQNVAGRAAISSVYRFNDFVRKEGELEVKARTLLYEASTMLPLLSEEQAECSRVSLPCEIMGSAGSGKSSIAVEMIRKKAAENPDLRILYVANNPALVKHIRECLVQAGVINPECLTFGEMSATDYHSLVTVQKDTFVKFRDSLFDGKYKAIDKDIFTMCFNSGIKGSAQLAETNQRIIGKDIFLRDTSRKENLSTELASHIYELAVRYDKHLKENDILDNNDLARRLISRAGEASFRQYDIIVADEIQDMTGLQVQALVRCCKNYNICFLGDRNQVIVPSTFDFGELERGIYGQLNGKATIQRVLKKTYRCGAQLIDYLNQLNALRRQKIGAGSQADDALEESMRGDADSSMIAVLVTNPAVCHAFLKKAKETAQCSIIVDNPDTRDELSSGADMPNIITVEDAKGLEYNIVVLYNFVRDNLSRFKEIFDDSGFARRSTLHRIVFNKYYVACTRAVDRIIICENTACAADFKDTLFLGLDAKNNIEELLSYLNPTADSWLTEAIRLYMNGLYTQADKYLIKYASMNPDNRKADYEKYKDLCECQLLLQQTMDSEVWIHCAETFELYKDYSSAREVYDKYLDDRFSVFRIDLLTGNPEYYLNHPEEVSRILSSARISDEDVKTLVNSAFAAKQVKCLLSATNTVLEVLKNGK